MKNTRTERATLHAPGFAERAGDRESAADFATLRPKQSTSYGG
jgi:hypothetical protein